MKTTRPATGAGCTADTTRRPRWAVRDRDALVFFSSFFLLFPSSLGSRISACVCWPWDAPPPRAHPPATPAHRMAHSLVLFCGHAHSHSLADPACEMYDIDQVEGIFMNTTLSRRFVRSESSTPTDYSTYCPLPFLHSVWTGGPLVWRIRFTSVT